jgi:hypothetical protein
MEKKGNILNQLAIIVDLIEKVNLEPTNKKLMFELNDKEFVSVYEYFEKKQSRRPEKVKDTFTITIESVDIIFNRNNV